MQRHRRSCRAGYVRLIERFPVESMIRATLEVYADVARRHGRREPVTT